ncbi:malonic semialdehyde reductase [Pacificimonas flava]|uniref:Putative NADH dehydrogenase/NAD(P)H nitroreductase C725_1840 n=1 Tax=Pacificimonas flava TaxID=1234595 RepID=M2SBQ9_9SPHN|nr:malonic semialdehyde reductase [Pacificimonas flava]EMD82800.1 reductase RutE [Pacificimonas flava]MBB5279416.1 nitroreductase [Pacificimonas flava]
MSAKINHLLSDRDLDLVFREARSYSSWSDKPVSRVELEAIYDLMRMGPTSANCSPARIIFCQSTDAREKLAACVDAGNVEKVRAAPVTAIVGMDMEFYEKLPQLFPHADARSWFAGNSAKIEETAFRNSSLQGAYMIIAARAVGLDCGPMSGFDKAKVDAEFFGGTSVETNFLCSLGHGTQEKLFPRSPRLSFEDACDIL